MFPGVISKVETVGSGKTHVLRGMAVVTAGKIVGFQEGIIDMSGPGAEYTPFSKLNNLVVVAEPNEGYQDHKHEYEHAVRIAGLRAATYIGELGRSVAPDETAVFETYGIKEGIEKMPGFMMRSVSGLPKPSWLTIAPSRSSRRQSLAVQSEERCLSARYTFSLVMMLQT